MHTRGHTHRGEPSGPADGLLLCLSTDLAPGPTAAGERGQRKRLRAPSPTWELLPLMLCAHPAWLQSHNHQFFLLGKEKNLFWLLLSKPHPWSRGLHSALCGVLLLGSIAPTVARLPWSPSACQVQHPLPTSPTLPPSVHLHLCCSRNPHWEGEMSVASRTRPPGLNVSSARP